MMTKITLLSTVGVLFLLLGFCAAGPEDMVRTENDAPSAELEALSEAVLGDAKADAQTTKSSDPKDPLDQQALEAGMEATIKAMGAAEAAMKNLRVPDQPIWDNLNMTSWMMCATGHCPHFKKPICGKETPGMSEEAKAACQKDLKEEQTKAHEAHVREQEAHKAQNLETVVTPDGKIKMVQGMALAEILEKGKGGEPMQGMVSKAHALRLKRAFDHLDMNKDNTIDHTDLIGMAKLFGKGMGQGSRMMMPGSPHAQTAQDIQERATKSLMKDLDHDGDGTISFKDYARYVANVAADPNYAKHLKAKRDAEFLEDLIKLSPKLGETIQKKKEELRAQGKIVF